MDKNQYDGITAYDVEEANKQRTEDEAKGNKIDYLIHRVFAQSEEGRELLEKWEGALILEPTANPGDDMITIGINEGLKRFIRNIKLTVRKVEGESK